MQATQAAEARRARRSTPSAGATPSRVAAPARDPRLERVLAALRAAAAGDFSARANVDGDGIEAEFAEAAGLIWLVSVGGGPVHA